MTMGLAFVEGTDNVLTVRAFIDHCQTLITEATIPGMTLHKFGATSLSDQD